METCQKPGVLVNPDGLPIETRRKMDYEFMILSGSYFMRIVHALTVLGLTAAFPAAASASESQDDGERLVCKNQAKTGTRFAKRVCRTRDQWEAMRENARRQAEEEFNRRTIETRRDQ
jgi:hypothetical protein